MEGPSKHNLAPSTRKSILGDLNARRNSVGKNAGKKKIQKSINELPQFSERVKKLAKRMLFRVKMYLMLNRAKKKQDMMNPGYSRLIRVLQNPFRSTASAEFILDYIKQLSFFGNFIRDLGDVDDSAIVELCKCLKYEYIPVATCIFKENDISNDKFYVILKGSVSFVKKKDANIIILEKEKEKEEAPPQQELKSPAEIKSPIEVKSPFLTTGAAELISPALKRPSILPLGKPANEDSANPGDDSSSQPDSMVHENIEQTTLFNLIVSLGIKVGEMHEGEGFGEKALLAKNSKRTASVVTNSNCDFIILSKKDYIDIITKFDKRSQAKMKFMKGCIPHLNSITSSEIWSNLFYLVREVDYSKGIILGAEGAPGKNIYFIHDGYCDLEKTIIVNRSKQHQKLEPLKIKRKLATFGCGSCLGEEILIGEDPKYEYNIVVSSIMAKIYIIDRQTFLKRFPWETVLAIIDAFKSKQFVHKQKIQKFTENLDTSKFEQSKQSMTVQTDHLSQLMRPAMRASMANHLKLLFTQEKNQERVQSVDSSHVRTYDTPTKPSPLQKAESTRLFMRGSLQPFHKETSFNSYQSKESKGTADLNGSMNSQQTEQKVYESDEINIEEPSSALSYRSGGRHFSENFRISPTFYNRRVETAKPDVKRPSKRMLTVATETSQERKSQFYVEEAPSPQFEKFDFGTPTSTTTKSQFRRTFLKQETQEGQGLEASTPTLKEPRSRLLTAVRDSPALDILVSEKEKRMFGKLRLGSRARSRAAETPTSNQTPIIKLDDLITIKTTVTEGTPKALSPGLAQRYWSIDDSEQQRPKSHFSKQKVRVIEIGKNEAELSKESLKLLMKNAEEGKKNTSKGTIKDKRRILDSLNTRKQKEKFNIKTMTKSMMPIPIVHTHKISSNNPSKYPTHQDLANT